MMPFARMIPFVAALLIFAASGPLRAQPAKDGAGRPVGVQAAEMTVIEARRHLEGLGLRALRFDEVDDGRYEFEAFDADGRSLEIAIRPDGMIHSFEVDDDARARSVDLARLLPEALGQALAERGIVDVVEFEIDDDHYEIEGYTAEGRKIEVELGFDSLPGTIAVVTDRRGAPERIDLGALSRSVETFGYAVEDARSRGPHVEMIAVNPEGERVRLNVDFDGVVFREILIR